MKFVSKYECPSCGDYPLHVSKRGGSFKLLWRLVGYSYYRCWRCGSLFVGRRNIPGTAAARDFSRRR